ncbi:hypothetical protein I4U23_002325 [Adineta vaga]|nr:hypothetical protein I4U23_002325 [Adineta vaga]
MPREQVEWYVEQSLQNGDEQLHGQQHCTYYSIVNEDKSKYPYSSSFEQKQTWTLTRTMSHHSKRYQTSIENIHLTVPCVLNAPKPFASSSTTTTTTTDHQDYDIEKTKVERSLSLLPPLPPTRQHALPTYRVNRSSIESKLNEKSHTKKNSIVEKPQSITNPMRIMRINGEFTVRI